MARPTPKVSVPGKRDRTVARLIEAANAVIAEKSFQRASLDEIAARAGMTKGAIYSNFGGKEDLFLAVLASKPLTYGVSYQPALSKKANFRKIGEACAAMMPNARGHAAFVAEYLLYVFSHEEMRLRAAKGFAAKLARPGPQALTQKVEGQPSYQTLMIIIQALTRGLTFQYALTPELVTQEVVITAFEALATARVPSKTSSAT